VIRRGAHSAGQGGEAAAPQTEPGRVHVLLVDEPLGF
jgi:hypothetical protein